MSAKRHLTPREEEVMRAIMRGQSSKEVAGSLGITEGAVESHRTSIIKRLKARNIIHAIGKFFRL